MIHSICQRIFILTMNRVFTGAVRAAVEINLHKIQKNVSDPGFEPGTSSV